ncbi:MAG: hypothetical protein N2507_06425 [Candidatus Bipolaricaulota bacterium]|nr:hypothetical protein [Candidatus Bipolaricaulota bacterium]
MPRKRGRGVEAFLGGKEAPSKATFYLPQDLLLELDDLWLDLRRVNRKVTKSDLVAFALTEVLRAYREKGRESPVCQAFAKKEEEWPRTE